MNWQKAGVGLLGAILISGTLYAAEAEPTLELTADEIEYNSASGVAKAIGNVVIVRDGATATADEGSYNTKNNEGRLTGGVTVVKETMNMTAREVNSFTNTKIVASGDVRMEKDGSVLTGESVEYDTVAEYVLMPTGGVAVTQEGTLTADKIEGYLKENKIIATGNVHIVSEPRNLVAAADQATYYSAEQGKLILTGNAVATQDGNTIKGKTLTLYMDEQPSGAK